MNVILAISGSISCYKSYDVARSLVGEGHSVKVVLTKGAMKFIRPQTFLYLGTMAVYGHGDDFNYPKAQGDDPILHISLARWSDKLIIVPLSANTASGLARGGAGDLLTSLFLAFEPQKPKIIFPSMNSLMLNHPFTKENLEKIKNLPNTFIHPSDRGLLACNETGEGRLAGIDEIVTLVETVGSKNKKKKVLITMGATLAFIDPVRYVTNPSSGLTGFYIAKECLNAGYSVDCIVGKYVTDKIKLLKHHPRFQYTRIATTAEMYHAVDKKFDSCDLYISPAAISDLECDIRKDKIKKKFIDHHINFKQSPDILESMIKRKKNQTIIAFAAETNLSKETLQEKFNRKPVDLLVGTKVFHDTRETRGFQVDKAHYIFFDGQKYIDKKMKKSSLAQFILEYTHFM